METSIATIIIQFSAEILLPSNYETSIHTKEKQPYYQSVNHNIQQKTGINILFNSPCKAQKSYALNE